MTEISPNLARNMKEKKKQRNDNLTCQKERKKRKKGRTNKLNNSEFLILNHRR